MFSAFQSAGIAVSCYPDNLVRVSLPAKRMSEFELNRFAAAL